VPSVFFALLGPLGAGLSVLDETSAKENPGEPGSVMHLLLPPL
jgi:hypothetical protein